MDIKTLEKRIDMKADAEVQDAIYEFKQAVRVAMDKLFKTRMNYASDMERPHYRVALEILGGTRKATAKAGGGWPLTLWDIRRNAIRKEIMSTMDTLQKTLLAEEPTEPPTNTMEATEPQAAVPSKPVAVNGGFHQSDGADAEL